MYPIGTYEYSEFRAVFGTDRPDAIKNKLTRQGYTFQQNGRGKKIQITIISLPTDFKSYCIETLGFDSRTNFDDKLKPFMKVLLDDIGKDIFINLDNKRMTEALHQKNIDITRQTVSNYFKKLIDTDWLYIDIFEPHYFQGKEEIDKAKANEIYKAFFEWYNLDKDDEHKKSAEANFEEVSEGKGTPKKRFRVTFNAFYSSEYNKVLELINK